LAMTRTTLSKHEPLRMQGHLPKRDVRQKNRGQRALNDATVQHFG
jgi:hypothetical protein